MASKAEVRMGVFLCVSALAVLGWLFRGNVHRIEEPRLAGDWVSPERQEGLRFKSNGRGEWFWFDTGKPRSVEERFSWYADSAGTLHIKEPGPTDEPGWVEYPYSIGEGKLSYRDAVWSKR